MSFTSCSLVLAKRLLFPPDVNSLVEGLLLSCLNSARFVISKWQRRQGGVHLSCHSNSYNPRGKTSPVGRTRQVDKPLKVYRGPLASHTRWMDETVSPVYNSLGISKERQQAAMTRSGLYTVGLSLFICGMEIISTLTALMNMGGGFRTPHPCDRYLMGQLKGGRIYCGSWFLGHSPSWWHWHDIVVHPVMARHLNLLASWLTRKQIRIEAEPGYKGKVHPCVY